MPLGERRHLVVLAVGFSVSIVVSSTFFGPHVAYDGQPLFQVMLTIFLLPTTASVIYFIFRSLQRRQLMLADAIPADPAVQTIVFWVLLFLIGVHVMVLAVLMGVRAIQPWASRAVVMLLGLTLTAIGNLLPRTRPNVALGIRTSRTLTDRQVWMLIHRGGGYICVAVGIVTVLAAALLSGPNVSALSGGAFLAGAAIMFVYYQRVSHVSRTSRAR
jgi:SdpI/YfhL protein family